MKKIILLVILGVVLNTLNAQSPRELLNKANTSYSQSQYKEALTDYLKIEEMGYASEVLFYNIGNTYFKLNEIGKSILYYERALKLNPSDKDLINNLTLAKEFTLDRIEEIPDFIIKTRI